MSEDYIGEFLAHHAERSRERDEPLLDSSLLRSCLEEFVLAELWHDRDPERLDLAIRSLGSMSVTDRDARSILTVLAKEVAGLRARLDRQCCANIIMQEHLVMLSSERHKTGP